MRPTPLLGLTAALLLGACSADEPASTAPAEQTSAPSTPDGQTTSPADGAGSSPTASPTDGETVALDAECALEPRQDALPEVVLRHPSDWQVTDPDAEPCSLFDPDDPEVQPATEVTGVAIVVNIDQVAYDDVTGSIRSLEETDRRETTVDGRQAVRLHGTTTGEGLGPAGVERTVWYVDVSQDGTDGLLVMSTQESDADDPERAQQVLDAMAEEARIG